MIKAGIVGGAGYTGGECIRLLLNHPEAELAFVQSESNAGNFLYDVHGDLLGETEMKFTAEVAPDADVLFFCMGHGRSLKFLEENKVNPATKIVDLGNDFRLKKDADASGRHFVYGLPECSRETIRKADSIANPGCFATAIQLALLPLAAGGLLKGEVQVSAITGSTGAGQKPSATTHFSWRANNLSTYKTFTHQHLGEIGETVTTLQPTFTKAINFVPFRGDFPRGIIAAVYTDCDLTDEAAKKLYRDYYADAAFTFVSDRNIDLKQVVNTNKAILFPEKHDGKLVIVSVIDNLLKGAAGQAVQNMNLMFGLDEKCGLRLKPQGF